MKTTSFLLLALSSVVHMEVGVTKQYVVQVLTGCIIVLQPDRITARRIMQFQMAFALLET